MKKIVLLLFFFSFFCLSFSLNIYPILNQLSMKPGEEQTVTIRLSATRYSEKVKIERKDFAIVSGSYVYDLPDYPYSLKPFLEIPYDEIELSAGQVVDLPVRIRIPRGFTGAQAFGSIFFSVSGGMEGGVTYLLNLVSVFIVDVENPKKMDMSISDVRFFDLMADDCPKELKETYGDFGTIVKLKVKNTGNMVLAVTGEMRLVSRELGRIVTTIPLDRTRFVVFPALEEEFTFFTDVLVPSGRLSVQIEGVSQNIRVAGVFETTGPERKVLEKAVRIEPVFKLFEADRTLNEKFQIHNLTPDKFQLSLSVKEPLDITPKNLTLAPYASSSLFVRYDPRKANLPPGDSVFRIVPLSDGEVRTLGTGVIVLRKGLLEPSYTFKILEYSQEDRKVALEVENTGKMTMEFSIVEKEPYRTTTLVESVIVFPGEKKTLRFFHNLPLELAKNAVLLRSRIYATQEWKEEVLPW